MRPATGISHISPQGLKPAHSTPAFETFSDRYPLSRRKASAGLGNTGWVKGLGDGGLVVDRSPVHDKRRSPTETFILAFVFLNLRVTVFLKEPNNPLFSEEAQLLPRCMTSRVQVCHARA